MIHYSITTNFVHGTMENSMKVRGNKLARDMNDVNAPASSSSDCT